MTNEEKARSLILLAMRTRDNETAWPARLTPSPELLQLVDEPTAQKIYQQILATIPSAR
jgi:hypothetical protein